MKTTLISLFTLICLNLHSQVKTVVMNQYFIFEMPSNMDFNDAINQDSIKNSFLYPYKLTYKFDFDNKIINMSDEEEWSKKAEIIFVNYIETEHFELFAKIDEQIFVFQLCKDIKGEFGILLVFEFKPEQPYMRVTASDGITCYNN
jgi:hypothetical protein